MIDIAIIGGGPAGLSAAINAAQRNKKVTVFGRGIETSMLYKAEKVDNYIGMPDITGKKMLEDFLDHAVNKGVEIKHNKVYQIFKTGDYFTLNADNNFIEAKKVIIASGIENSKFDVARDAVLEQLRDLCEGGLTEEELEQARRTKINALRSMQDVPRSMESYWQTRMMCGLDENVDALIKRLENVTLEDVVAAGRTLRVALIYFLKGVGA